MNTQPLTQGSKLLKNFYAFGVASLMSLALFVATTTPVLASPLVAFNGTGVGPIPDQPGADTPCQTPGPPRDVQFAVTGLTANIQSLSVSITLNHPYLGDVVASLIPPAASGRSPFVLFGYVGSNSTAGNAIFGDSSNFGGTYIFSDAAPATPTLWQAAATAAAADIIPSGSYRTTTIGGSAAGGTVTSLNAAFAGLTPAQANGTWTLRVTDGCNGDEGSVTAAVLDITTATVTPTATKPFFDYFGSGKSSFGVTGISGANRVWRIRNNGGTGQEETVFWGLSTDSRTPGYFDADNRADINVWRSSATAGQSFFYIRQSGTTTLRAVPFGSLGDASGRDADYDGDGIDDLTLLRRVGNRWLWSYLASTNNTLRSFYFGTAATTQAEVATEDFPFAGADFSGDGRADFVVLRQNAAGAETYLWGNSTSNDQVLGSAIWGEFNTDFYVLGDFLGDARYDFAVWRGFGAGTDGNWYIRENGGTGFVARNFGIPGADATRDIAIAGDFGGDSKNDIAVYRPSNNTFYWLNTPTATTVSGQRFGQPGDLPVGALRTY